MKKRLVGAGLACVVTCLLLASTTAQGQDLTTMLNLFLRDLYAGAIGTSNSLGFLAKDGTASAPSISFASDPTTGFYRSAAGEVSFSSAGSQRIALGAATLSLVGSGATIQMGNPSDTSLSRGGAAGKLTLTGTTPMFQLGGTSSSFPALRQNSTIPTRIDVVKADASAFAPFAASAFYVGSSGNGVLLISDGAPAAPSSCGTSPAVTTSNGTAAFVITGGTGGTATGCTITMPAATTGWNCSINNITSSAAHRADKTTVQTASTTTSVTWEYQTVSTGAATAFTASDVFRGVCFAY